MSKSKWQARHDKIRESFGLPKLRRDSEEPQPPESKSETRSEHSTSGPTQSDPDMETELGPYYLDGDMPSYNFIGKLARQCLVNGYKLGTWRFDCTSELGENAKLYSFGAGKPNSKSVVGGFEFGERLGMFHLSQAFRTDGLFGTLGMRSEIFGGLGLSMLRAIYNHDEENKDDRLTLEVQAALEFDPFKIELIAPLINGSMVSGYTYYEHPSEIFICSVGAVVDVPKLEVNWHELGVGIRSEQDYTEIGLKLENFKNIKGSIFQRISENIVLAVMARMTEWKDLKVTIGGQYEIDDEKIIKARICSTGYMGIVYQVDLNESIQFMTHVGFNVKHLVDGTHTFGVACNLSC
ncbi:PREDICTED: uncharacterized protein LOC108611501 [Drosophila arizonae]|uniref:Uncharacterized protein LOC108611501 n=1 Tax=Drosophila arizonae TaxID=7263 RepID=A0ABM1NXJ4_DROAR|nr:PREDICTED: uncharacterized protein LOC108611501 [Drosophila arizonae]